MAGTTNFYWKKEFYNGYKETTYSCTDHDFGGEGERNST